MKRLKYLGSILLLLIIGLQPSFVEADEMGDDPAVRVLEDEIIYDILIDRLNIGDQTHSEQVDLDDPRAYHGGDLQGVMDKLEYLDEAGFTAISLSPIMENVPGGYHGYWVDDFFTVENEFGSMDDLKKLIKKVHSLDMKVILELDVNYIARESALVEEHPDWFIEVDTETTDATEWLEEVVRFDQTKTDATQYLLDVAEYWMDEVDIDGYHLHAADQTDPEFLEDFTGAIKQKDYRFYLFATTLQEDGDTDALTELTEIESIDAVSSPTMSKSLNDTFKRPDEPVSAAFDMQMSLPDKNPLLYFDNMNTARFSSNFAEEGRVAETSWKLALGYLYTMPGVPIIYQGSEVPMYAPGFPENQAIVDFTSADPDLEDVFSKMAAIRSQYPSLARGDVEQVATNEGMSVFKRTYENEIVYVAVNNDSESRNVEITSDELTDEVMLRGLLYDDTIRQNKDGTFLIGMERESTEVLVIHDDTGFNWLFIGFVIFIFVLFIGFIIVMSVKQKKREKK